uniref:Uncharacterized protein n=1 Tax=Avena sativa TaxID=4498 RepID=A0ACD5WNB5_AVESA
MLGKSTATAHRGRHAHTHKGSCSIAPVSPSAIYIPPAFAPLSCFSNHQAHHHPPISYPSSSLRKRVMASGCPTTTPSSLLLFFLLSCLLIGHALGSNQGHHGSISDADYGEQYPHQGLTGEHIDLQENMKQGLINEEKPPRYARRMMIGSTAPICTYNECRGCRSKCTAEQVPVDANDPMNSAYHYKCVCHR